MEFPPRYLKEAVLGALGVASIATGTAQAQEIGTAVSATKVDGLAHVLEYYPDGYWVELTCWNGPRHEGDRGVGLAEIFLDESIKLDHLITARVYKPSLESYDALSTESGNGVRALIEGGPASEVVLSTGEVFDVSVDCSQPSNPAALRVVQVRNSEAVDGNSETN